MDPNLNYEEFCRAIVGPSKTYHESVADHTYRSSKNDDSLVSLELVYDEARTHSNEALPDAIRIA